MPFSDWGFRTYGDLFTSTTIGTEVVDPIEGNGSLFYAVTEGSGSYMYAFPSSSTFPSAKTAGRLRSLVKIRQLQPGNTDIGNDARDYLGILCMNSNVTNPTPGVVFTPEEGYFFGIRFETVNGAIGNSWFVIVRKRDTGGMSPTIDNLKTEIPTQNILGHALALNETVALEMFWYADEVTLNAILLGCRAGSALDCSNLQTVFNNVGDIPPNAYLTTLGEGPFAQGNSRIQVNWDNTQFNELTFN